MRAHIYIGLILLSGALILVQSVQLGWTDVAPIVFVILLHAPAFVPVSLQRKLFRINLKVSPYPELPLPFFILIAWVAVGLNGQILAFSLGAGFCFAVSIALQLFAVRAADSVVRSGNLSGAHNPRFNPKPMVSDIKSSAFFLRTLTVSLSLTVTIVTILGSHTSFWWVPGVIIAPIFSAMSVASTSFSVKSYATIAGRTAKSAIASTIASAPPACVVYYSSSSKAKHDAMKTQVSKLTATGLKTAVIAREPHSVAACVSSSADYKWASPTIDALDAFVQPSIKAAIYINNAARNAHFIRYNQLVHVLVATAGKLAQKSELTTEMAVYDAIIAPNVLTAQRWRSACEQELAQRIFTIKGTALETVPNIAGAAGSTRVALCLTPNSVREDEIEILGAKLESLVEWAMSDEDRRLSISFSEKTKDAVLRNLRLTIEDIVLDNTNVEIRYKSEAAVCNGATVLIATRTADLWDYVKTGKPVLWFGGDDEPKGITQLKSKKSDIVKQIDEMLHSNIDPDAIIQNAELVQYRFPTMASLIDNLYQKKFPEGVKT